MSSPLDTFAEVLRSTLRFAGVHYPLHMLAGLSGGIVLDAILEVAGASAPDASWRETAAGLHIGYSMALGVLVAVVVIRIGGKRLDEQTERDLDLIERVIARGELGQVDRRLAWRNVLAKAVEAFRPGGGRALDAQQLAEGAVRETQGLAPPGGPDSA